MYAQRLKQSWALRASDIKGSLEAPSVRSSMIFDDMTFRTAVVYGSTEVSGSRNEGRVQIAPIVRVSDTPRTICFRYRAHS